MVGAVVAAYAIPQVLLRIPIGIWADNLKRKKPLIAAGMVASALGALGLGGMTSPWLLFLARLTAGVGAAVWVVFTIYFTAYYPPEKKGRAIGLISFVQSGALVVTTASGGAIAQALNPRYTFFMAIPLALISLAIFLFSREQPLERAEGFSWRSFSSVATCPLLLTVSGMGILLQFTSSAGLFSFIPIYATSIGASSADLGLLNMASLGFGMVGTLVAVRVWERSGYRMAIFLGALLATVSTFTIPFIQDVPVLIATQAVCGLGRSMLMTSLMTLSIRDVAPKQQATAMGIYQAVYAVGMLAGPLVSGFLGDRLGLDSIFFLTALLSSLIMALAFLPAFSRK